MPEFPHFFLFPERPLSVEAAQAIVDNAKQQVRPEDFRTVDVLANAFSLLGEAYSKQGNYVKSLKAYKESLRAYERIAAAKAEDKQAIHQVAITHKTIGDIHTDAGAHLQAAESYRAAIRYYESPELLRDIDHLLSRVTAAKLLLGPQQSDESKTHVELPKSKPVGFEAPPGPEDDLTRKQDANTEARIQRLLDQEEIPHSARRAASREIRKALARAKSEVESRANRDSTRVKLKPPVPLLTPRQVSVLVARGRKHSFAGRKEKDNRTPYEWIRDTYRQWYPGIMMHHLKQADLALWQLLHKRASRARKGEAEIPDWFDVPTKKENRLRAAKPEDREAIQQARRLDREGKRLRAQFG